MQISLV